MFSIFSSSAAMYIDPAATTYIIQIGAAAVIAIGTFVGIYWSKVKRAFKKKEEEVLIAKADLINYRKRKDEEVVRMLKFCNEDLIKQMLPVLDNFERAIKLDDNNLEDEVSKFLEGFKMIYCNMQNIMGSFEVKPIDGTNIPFDPVYHNAILVEKVEGVEPGVVIEVLQKGYIYKDKVIRPAMVKVSE